MERGDASPVETEFPRKQGGGPFGTSQRFARELGPPSPRKGRPELFKKCWFQWTSAAAGRVRAWGHPGGCMCLLAALSILSGCGKTMAESDCQRVADHLREIWEAEAKAAAEQRPASNEGENAAKAAAVIQAEGDRVVGEFLSECKKDLAGRKVDGAEVSCILAAKDIAGVNECGGKKAQK